MQLQSGALLNSLTDLIFDPLANLFLTYLPRWSLFLVGLGIILVSFNLFDKCLPQMSIKESQVGRVSRLVYRPAIMFLLGASVTMVSMSVSVSLSILVPLSHRGFVRRENVIPYIMGANITTFIDTLLAAVLLNNPRRIYGCVGRNAEYCHRFCYYSGDDLSSLSTGHSIFCGLGYGR